MRKSQFFKSYLCKNNQFEKRIEIIYLAYKYSKCSTSRMRATRLNTYYILNNSYFTWALG